VFFVLFDFILCLVPSVSCFSWLSILDCPVGFRWRLFYVSFMLILAIHIILDNILQYIVNSLFFWNLK
jgi:hypothetical protein